MQTDPPAATAYSQLFRNPKFQDYLALRHLSERDMARHYGELLRNAEVILTRLRQQLE